MKIEPTPLPGVFVVEPRVVADERGWFMEAFHEARFAAALAERGAPAPGRFVQDNHSVSHAGVLRGLHHQLPPHAQGRLVRVVRGRAYDVAIDIRRSSPTFGRWFGIELGKDPGRQLWIPPGVAHGFLALEDDTHFLYKTTGFHAPASERTIRWNDPALGIDWPLAGTAPRLSARDADAPTLAESELPA
jgi:dTDP-4-dehydrorhamnose 3,5-epimerase